MRGRLPGASAAGWPSSSQNIWARVPRQKPSSGMTGEDCSQPPDGVADTMLPARSTISKCTVSPRTTLSPTLALRDGEPYLAWGSPGGDQQDQWTTQLFMRHVHAGMNLQEAIDAPAWHSEHFPISFWPRTARPGVLVVEGRLPAATVKELERRGHIVEVDADWCEGRLTAAARDGRRRRAAANPRGMQAYAAGR